MQKVNGKNCNSDHIWEEEAGDKDVSDSDPPPPATAVATGENISVIAAGKTMKTKNESSPLVTNVSKLPLYDTS